MMTETNGRRAEGLSPLDGEARDGQHGIVEEIKAFEPELIAIRRDIHRHPETGFEETAPRHSSPSSCAPGASTSPRESRKTGVVGTLKGNRPGQRAIGLRADLDALHIREVDGRDARLDGSGQDARLRPRRPHHDAARRRALSRRKSRLRRHRAFHLPARRGRPGRRPVDGRGGPVRPFPVDAVYGMHNAPGLPVGAFATRKGPFLAAERHAGR